MKILILLCKIYNFVVVSISFGVRQYNWKLTKNLENHHNTNFLIQNKCLSFIQVMSLLRQTNIIISRDIGTLWCTLNDRNDKNSVIHSHHS